MQVDAFTLIAQIINFLILLYLLYRFLYNPILNTMQAREEKISNRLEQARQRESEAEEYKSQYQEELSEIDQIRKKKLNELEEDIDNRRKEMIQEAREQVDQRKAAWYETLEREQEDFLHELRHKSSQQISQALRKALRDLANSDLDRQIQQVFIEKVQQIDDENKQRILEAARRSNQKIYIQTSESVQSEEHQKMIETIEEFILDGNDEIDILFERNPSILAGVELQADGQRLSWSIDAYLDELEDNIAQLIQEEIETGETAANE